MSRRRDEVKEGMHPVIPELSVTDNARLFRKDVIVLMLEVTHDFLETVVSRSMA
jgi:hypothetical protein